MTGMDALVFSREIVYDSVIYGLSIAKHLEFIKCVLVTLCTSFDCECLARWAGRTGAVGRYMPTTLECSLSH